MVFRPWFASFDAPVMVSGGQGKVDCAPDGVGTTVHHVWHFSVGMGRGSARVRRCCGSMLGLLHQGSCWAGRRFASWFIGGVGATSGRGGAAFRYGWDG